MLKTHFSHALNTIASSEGYMPGSPNVSISALRNLVLKVGRSICVRARQKGRDAMVSAAGKPSNYYRGSEAEPTKEALHDLFVRSSPSEWIYDEESKIFTYKKDLLVFLHPDPNGSYNLRYGHMDILEVPGREILRFLRGSTRVDHSLDHAVLA
jgi:hypothetical protein